MRWNYPCDPDCPGYQRVMDDVEMMTNDPMTIHYGVDTSEFEETWTTKHRISCPRCQKYGAANVEVV